MSQILDYDVRLVAAVIAATVALIVSIPSTLLSFLRFSADTALQQRLSRVIRTILQNDPQRFVPFRVLRHHIGGFEDDELRRYLVQCGALRLSDANQNEYWILVDRLEKDERVALLNIDISPSSHPPTHTLFGSH